MEWEVRGGEKQVRGAGEGREAAVMGGEGRGGEGRGREGGWERQGGGKREGRWWGMGGGGVGVRGGSHG